MLTEADRILAGLTHEFQRLRAQLGEREIDGSSSQAIANGLRMLRHRERGDIGAVRKQFESLGALLDRLADALGGGDPDTTPSVGSLRAAIARAQTLQSLRQLETEWRSSVTELQRLVSSRAVRGLPGAAKDAVCRALTAWESGDLIAQSGAEPISKEAHPCAVEIDRENLMAYLRDRFGESGLEVRSVEPLAGGFGKQTLLFDVEGGSLSGSFVMRRDIGARASVPNDCHLTRHEFPVLRAALHRGLPAPEALWVDTEHRLLPGGDFIVMRRSPGRLAGNFFGAQTAIPPGLTDVLADVTAQLHTLPPLLELGDLTDSIRSELWNLPLRASTERYIRGWFELFEREDHTASPALVGLYGWLLDNVPERSGRPVLVHGDIGFHNFLFEGDRLSAVLDWEFAHIGDPAEDLGYIKVSLGAALDWDHLMRRYQAAGGMGVDEAALRYYQVWAYVRNATAANLISTLFAIGAADDLKLAFLPVGHIPHYLRRAQALIDS